MDVGFFKLHDNMCWQVEKAEKRNGFGRKYETNDCCEIRRKMDNWMVKRFEQSIINSDSELDWRKTKHVRRERINSIKVHTSKSDSKSVGVLHSNCPWNIAWAKEFYSPFLSCMWNPLFSFQRYSYDYIVSLVFINRIRCSSFFLDALNNCSLIIASIRKKHSHLIQVRCKFK